ncbi:MAG: hypothetical protein RLP44_23510 [Aggregatilineales bacterium]
MLSQNMNPPIRLLAGFNAAYSGRSTEHLIYVPGRSMWVAAVGTDTVDFSIHVPDLEARTTFSLRTAKFKKTVLNRPLPQWGRFPAGVLLELCNAGMDIEGLGAVIVGDETHGIRYEYGLGVAVAALVFTIHDTPYSDDDLIDIVEKVRREYVGG